ncbi:uncharacterized protein LOC133927506 [Phragmites australis]|uniref:uncharacterized protein LOC133927506 n=1 Tax=Phragmites australis TaxID=29695 RepID=UPI002D788E0F|nr:uncharacterized protein LOC133927506 [Phragmites australis]
MPCMLPACSCAVVVMHACHSAADARGRAGERLIRPAAVWLAGGSGRPQRRAAVNPFYGACACDSARLQVLRRWAAPRLGAWARFGVCESGTPASGHGCCLRPAADCGARRRPRLCAAGGRPTADLRLRLSEATTVGATALSGSPSCGRVTGAGRTAVDGPAGCDLKNYFTSLSGGSSSSNHPSTHESRNAADSIVGEVEGHATIEAVVSNIAQVEIGVDDAQPQAQQEENEQEGIDLIVEFNPLVHVVADPALRIPIEGFHPNIKSEVRRAYLLRGPTQPIGHNFPRKRVGKDWRLFQPKWFKDYDWLEYSVSKDAAFCFYCFLFRQEAEHEKFGHVVFTKTGYDDWKHTYRGLPGHVGGVSGCHNKTRLCTEDFKNQRASISHKIDSNSKDAEMLYEVRLTAALDVASYLISQGHAFRRHDESASSLNKGNFLEMIDWYKKRNEEVRVAFDELCPKTARMTSHKIQKDLTQSCAEEITEVIKEEIGDSLFSILIDESRDISIAEQMAVLVRFVNKKGMVVERFLGLKHVEDTTSNALKKALTEVLADHGLSIAKLRGQGYDGASNMRGEFNGLQKQIRDENPYAFYVHCFAHQLQLVIISVATYCSSFDDFFNYVNLIVTSTSASCKRKDKLLAKHRETILAKLESGEIFKGRGKHQSTNLTRPRDTRWGSHFTTLVRIELMWDSVVKVLAMIHEDERNPGRAGGLVRKMESFSFVLNMKLMLKVFRITHDLSLLMQRKDQNIVQAMSLLIDVKARLITFRNEGWEPLLEEVESFCVAKYIPIPNMDEAIPRWGRSRLDGNLITQEHHYRVDTFFTALDAIITEMDHRFNEVSSELLVCFSCLDPRNSFSKFDVGKIARLTEIYDEDFTIVDRSLIKDQLETFIIHVRRIDDFTACHDLGSLAVKMVETEKHIAFPLVYRLIELALILPVATASVERAFSAMHLIKTDLRNKMSDDWLNYLLVCYIEKEIFKGLDCDKIKKRFQVMKDRKMDLPRKPKGSRSA